MIRFHYGLAGIAVAAGLCIVSASQPARATIKNWTNYNNNWNKNWNNHAYVRNWNHRPYYGQFVGGVVLGSILAATGVGIVPYAPQPNLCWYWADPYMYRGYWDYCY